MTHPRNVTDNGSWPYALELFEQGDSAFVDEIRRITDADRLGDFAARWHADRRPAARDLLHAYLDRSLNTFRHEALVKRLFKLAEGAWDDELMAWFLVAFDRTVRRVRRKVRHHDSATLLTQTDATALLARWEAAGYGQTNLWAWGGQFHVYGVRSEEALAVPAGKVIWRPEGEAAHHPNPIPEYHRTILERKWLFSLRTRRYLRRRTWRYFRRLGRQHPDRFVPAVATALKGYTDADVADGLALLDNWGLIHILFHHSPAIQSGRKDWTVAEGHALDELAPAPIYEDLWKAAPQALFDLVKAARCRPVRRWALLLLQRYGGATLATVSPEEWFTLLGHESAEVAAFAAERLRSLPDLSVLGLDRWLALLEDPNPQTVEIVCDLLASRLRPDGLTLEQTTRLAGSRPLPVAWLGFRWLRTKTPAGAADYRALLALADAQAEPLRPEIVRWVRGVLGSAPSFDPAWVLEFLDSRHADVRAEGWRWFQEEPRTRDDVAIWRKMLESPYDDVRLLLVADLEGRVARGGNDLADAGTLDDELLRFLWASVLLNVNRGGRAKPVVVGQVVRRLGRRPAEAAALLPLLAVALRSLRGPEWRVGLAGIVGLVERHPDLGPLVKTAFPELRLV
jgi:hypothetical protein